MHSRVHGTGTCTHPDKAKRTQAFLSSFGLIRQHFALKRHLLRASLYRKQLASRFAAWREFTGIAQNPSTVSD
ncbi:hypothetical protein OKW49_006274 [Paraburkholderia youngii]